MEIPININNILNELNIIRDLVKDNKKISNELEHRFNKMDKIISKYLNKEINIKIKKKEKSNKPKGIAIPVNVSNVLCEFMEEPINTKISRTSATKYLIEYIKKNDLIDKNDKRIIIPDERLLILIGDEAKEENLNLFNIQKYLNKHFIR